MYCRPPATGPPPPSLKKGSILASAPPPLSSTTPVRMRTTRTPRRSAAAASRSHTAQTWARKSSAAGSDSSRTSSPRCPYQPIAEARDQRRRARVRRLEAGDEVARALLARRDQPALGLRVPALGDVLAGEVDHAVAAGQRGGGGGRGLGIPGDGLDAERGVRLPRVAREHGHLVAALAQPLTSRVPIRPVAPVTVTRIRPSPRSTSSPSIRARAAAGIGQSWTARNSPVSLWA